LFGVVIRLKALAEKLHEDLQAAERVRSAEKGVAAVRVAVQDCADLSCGEVSGQWASIQQCGVLTVLILHCRV
jgi:hypothetical protein